MIDERETHYRFCLMIDAIGLEPLERDPVVAAVFDMHRQRENFSLSACLADMVKALSAAKADITRLAIEQQMRTSMPMVIFKEP